MTSGIVWPHGTPVLETLEPRLMLSGNGASPPGSILFEFSLDIASDAGMSDPQADGDEAFDPGDVYMWQGPAVAPPGQNGFKDDALIFGLDPAPDPADPVNSLVPVGFGQADDYAAYFDLDGHDQLDVDLSWLIPAGQHLYMPIERFDLKRPPSRTEITTAS